MSGGTFWTQPDIIYYRLNTGTGFGAETVLKQLSASGCTTCSKFTLTPLGGWAAYQSSTRTRRPDFNNDGRFDFFVNEQRCASPSGASCGGSITYNWTLFVSDPTTIAYQQLGVVSFGATGLASNARTPLIGDFNGDGCSDVATAQSGVWVLQYGTCYRSGATTVLSAPVFTTTPAYGIYPMALDWDGDGLDDIVEPNATTGGFFGYAHSTGSGLGAWTSTGISYNNSDTTSHVAVVADVNGDGLGDIVYGTTAGSVPTVLPHAGAGIRTDLATSFTDGFGINASPSYVLTTNPTYYTKGSGAAFPEQDEQAPHSVVGAYSATDGVGGTYTVSELYQNARLNLQRRGFEGFGIRREIDSRNNFQNYTYCAQTFPLTGMTLEQTVKQSNGTTLISDVTNTLASFTLDATTNSQRIFPYVSQSVSLAYEMNGALNGQLVTQVTTAYSFLNGASAFDVYGNLWKVTTTTVDKDSTSPWLNNTFTDIVNITPHEDGSTAATGWCIGKTDQVSDQRTEPGPTSLTHATSYSVSTDGLCRVMGQTVEPSSSIDKVVTTYGYTDGCNNVNTVTVTGQTPAGAAMTPRMTTVGYGSHCLKPESVTNALSQTSIVGYRYDLGLQNLATDANGLTATTSYNDLGQLQTQVRPDGTQTTIAIAGCSGSGCLSDPLLRYSVQRSEQDATSGHATFWYTQEYFDAFGRPKYQKPLQS
ncbi:MAG: toxin TcdB middle/N-terminal domain-containing protein, partial [Thermoleophilia bacterium]